MKQSEFNFTGSQLAEAGQRLAIDHANDVKHNWSDKAYRLLTDYVACYGNTPFKAEDVRAHAAVMDFDLPPHNRAWGGVFSKAKNEGLIRSTGTVKVDNPKAHSCYATLWIRA